MTCEPLTKTLHLFARASVHNRLFRQGPSGHTSVYKPVVLPDGIDAGCHEWDVRVWPVAEVKQLAVGKSVEFVHRARMPQRLGSAQWHARMPCHADDQLQRGSWDWNGHPVQLGYRRGDRVLEAVCALQSHVFGWELILTVNGLLARCQVCRPRDEVLDVGEEWRAAMVGMGWK